MSTEPIKDDPDLSRILEDLREVPATPPEMRARVKSHLEAVGQVAGAAGGAAGGAALVSAASAGWMGAIVGLGLGVAIGWSLGAGQQNSGPVETYDAGAPLGADAAVAVPPRVPTDAGPIEDAQAVILDGAGPDEQRASMSERAGRRSSPSRRRTASLAAERRLIDAAFAALREGNHDEARRAIERHQSRFPNGALAAEREVLRGRLER